MTIWSFLLLSRRKKLRKNWFSSRDNEIKKIRPNLVLNSDVFCSVENCCFSPNKIVARWPLWNLKTWGPERMNYQCLIALLSYHSLSSWFQPVTLHIWNATAHLRDKNNFWCPHYHSVIDFIIRYTNNSIKVCSWGNHSATAYLLRNTGLSKL